MARPASIPVGANRNEAILEIIIEEPHEQEPEIRNKEQHKPQEETHGPVPKSDCYYIQKNFDGLAELLCLHVAVRICIRVKVRG